MSVIEPNTGAAGAALFARIKGLFLAPTREWEQIASERSEPKDLVLRYLLPLAAAAALAGAIGMIVFGAGLFGISVRQPPLTAIILAAIQAAMVIGMTLVMGFVINALAPSFGAQANQSQAIKVAVYAATGALVAGLLNILPAIGALAILGVVFSVYLLHLGLNKVMLAPAEKLLGFTASVIAVMVVLWIVAGVAFSTITAPIISASLFAGGGKPNVTITAPGGDKVNVDIKGLEKAAKDMEAAAKRIETEGLAAPGAAIDLEQLKALMPQSLPGGFQRTSISSGTTGMVGYSAGGVTGEFTAGERTIKLSIGDMGPMAAIAGMAGALQMQTETETADGFERARMRDGRFTMERQSKSAKTAEFAQIVGGRFIVSAEGTNVDFAGVQAAFAAVDGGKLEALAKAK